MGRKRTHACVLCLLTTAASITSQADTTPPSVPQNLRILQAGPYSSRMALQWNASTDAESGIKEYILWRNGDLEVTRNGNTIGVDQWLLPDTSYSWTVTAIDHAGNESAHSEPLAATSLATPPLPTQLVAQTILLKFPDFPEDPFTTNFVYDMIYNPDTNSVRAFFSENSYSNMDVNGGMSGWYTLPYEGSNYCTFTLNSGLWYGCNMGAIWSDAQEVLPPEIDLDGSDVNLVIIQGMGTVGLSGGPQKYFAAKWLSHNVIAHEVGHSIPGANLKHAAGLYYCNADYPFPWDLDDLKTNGCSLIRYGDTYDTMAAGNSFHFNAYMKLALGMLSNDQLITADSDGLYTVDQFERPSEGYKALVIPLHRENFYIFEYRTPVGFDGPDTPVYSPSSPPTDGILVRYRPDHFVGSDADTVWPYGLVLDEAAPFVDPYRGIRVDVISKDGQQAQLKVTGLSDSLRTTSYRDETNDRHLTFSTVPGAHYELCGSSDLVNWEVLEDHVASTTNSITFNWADTGTHTSYFYQVRVSD